MITYKFADKKNIPAIQSLLAKENLPCVDINCAKQVFIIAKANKKIVGCVGLEPYKNYGLLRSLTVKNDFRNKAIGTKLVKLMSAYACTQKIKKLFILTITAKDFFESKGFCQINRTAAPRLIKNSSEFKTICPKTAIFMEKDISSEAQYYPKEILKLKPDVLGAKMFAVALKKTMFTYFQIQPNSIFKTHNHKSEQITMVLEGELFFKIGSRIECVHSGEVIAIPSNIKHSVFTKNKSVKAVDAWSPIRKDY